jgi:hypothetical protein
MHPTSRWIEKAADFPMRWLAESIQRTVGSIQRTDRCIQRLVGSRRRPVSRSGSPPSPSGGPLDRSNDTPDASNVSLDGEVGRFPDPAPRRILPAGPWIDPTTCRMHSETRWMEKSAGFPIQRLAGCFRQAVGFFRRSAGSSHPERRGSRRDVRSVRRRAEARSPAPGGRRSPGRGGGSRCR